MLRYYDRGDFSLIDTHFSLAPSLLILLNEQFGLSNTKELCSLVNVRYSDQTHFRMALTEHLGAQVEQIPDLFWKQANTGRQPLKILETERQRSDDF